MSDLLEYKGYYGTVEFSAADKVLFGKVVGINSLISYEGDNIISLNDDFMDAVDDYLKMCAEEGIEPEKIYKGSFNVRISPELHKKIVLYSTAHGQTLNATVANAIEFYMEKV